MSGGRLARHGLLAGIAAICLGAGLSGTTWADRDAVYPDVVPGTQIRFPEDEGSHPDYRIEWWYITGWLEDADDEPLGFQVTFFRARVTGNEDNPSRFAVDQLLFAHAAVSDPARGRLLHAERSARTGFGLAEAGEGRTDVVLEDWRLEQTGDEYLAHVVADDFEYELSFVRTQPPLLHGRAGYSQKGPDPRSASYYYTHPHLAVSGTVTIAGRARTVQGEAWFDHEWSSQILDADAVGWDWVGLNLPDGGALMAFRLRDEQGGEHWAQATLRDAEGRVTTYGPDEVDWRSGRTWTSQRTGIVYPVTFEVTVGERVLRLEPLIDDQESDSRGSTGTIYWEGAVRAFDESGDFAGRGYLELTGYGERLRL
jgi:predicted secreted hydrolase